jgi:hypothetical protein
LAPERLQLSSNAFQISGERGNWFFEPLLPIVVTRRASTSFFARIKTQYEDRIIAILNGHS